jgi:hypothetical protein
VRLLSDEERAKRKKERIPMLIVQFFSHELRDSVMLCRRSLKKTGQHSTLLQEDMTARNYKLLQSLKRCDKVDATWTWNGKIFAKVKGATNRQVFYIFDDLLLFHKAFFARLHFNIYFADGFLPKIGRKRCHGACEAHAAGGGQAAGPEPIRNLKLAEKT